MLLNKAFMVTTALVATSLLGCSSTGAPSNGISESTGLAPYAGIGVGGSFLNANTTGLTLQQDQSYSPAAQLTLGLSLNGPLALELRAADLGEATFDNGDAVGYQVADASLLYRHRIARWSGFARIGGGALFNDGDIEATQKNKSHFLIGAGAEYALGSRLSLRAEWQGHDVDVMHSQISLLYRFGGNLPRRPVAISSNDKPSASPEPQSEPISQSVTTVTPTAPKRVDAENSAQLLDIESTPNPSLPAAQESLELAETRPLIEDAWYSEIAPQAVVPAPQVGNTASLKPLVTVPIAEKVEEKEDEIEDKISVVPAEFDKDGIEDASDSCVGAANGMPVFADGCAMFGDSVAGLSFFPETDRLTSTATVVLDEVANALNKESDIRVTVAAHTRASSDSNAAMFLTRRRTIAIIRYLTSKGIDATRLRPEAYGDSQPLASAVEPSDNDRVVLTMQ